MAIVLMSYHPPYGELDAVINYTSQIKIPAAPRGGVFLML